MEKRISKEGIEFGENFHTIRYNSNFSFISFESMFRRTSHHPINILPNIKLIEGELNSSRLKVNQGSPNKQYSLAFISFERRFRKKK